MASKGLKATQVNGKVRTTATIKPLPSNDRKHPEMGVVHPQLQISKANSRTCSNVKVDSRKVCNEKLSARPSEVVPDGEAFDFAAHMKTVRPTFNRFGQHEPATVRIKNIITQYVGDKDGCGVEELIKELMQNSDDAQATEIHFVLDKRTLPSSRVWEEWKSMQGPALCVQNNSIFSDKDIESIQKLGVGSKAMDPDKTGQFGIGFNVVYQLTDCPILLSDHKDICMFDPHLKYVPGACDERPGGHIDLHQDPTFAKLYPDFMAGFLRGHVNHAGCTVFRFPLRQPDVKSQICDMTFAPPDVRAMESVFLSVDFRMFLHSTLLFTKNLNQVKVSVVEEEGTLQQLVQVKRLIAHTKQQQLISAQKKLLYELRLLMSGQIKPQEVASTSISYHLQTEDDYLKNDWFMNQTFGFHGDMGEKDIKFLESFYGEESKKFLPIAGIATKLNASNLMVAHAYSFLPLPIQTGLPVHINGHFAIHSSRRSIWEHTSFGHWNKVLRDYIISPSFCHFLIDLGKTFHSVVDVKKWVRFLPEKVKAKDDYFASLIHRVYTYMVEADLPTIPVPRNDALSFYSPKSCLYTTAVRNKDLESLLLTLNERVCTSPEVGMRFKMAGINGLKFINSTVVLECLKSVDLGLPKPISKTPFCSNKLVDTVLKFVLDGPASKDYEQLVGAPLCLTMDNTLKLFSSHSPVFMDSVYAGILPEHTGLFLHEDISENFSLGLQKNNGTIRSLAFSDIGVLLSKRADYMNITWSRLMWKFIKTRVGRNDIVIELSPLRLLPVIPVSDGRMVSIEEAEQVLSTAEASKNMQMVVEAMGLLRLEAKLIADDEVTVKDINQLATPFMLNAALPSAFLQALASGSSSVKIHHLKIEHAEILLQYLSLDAENIKDSVEMQRTVKSLPIFEDVDGAYKAILDSHGVILDSCIPTHGVTHWMERSNCLLLKEKAAYTVLYAAVQLEKKNAIEVYLDDIFPNFPSFDNELRISHLTSIRTSVLPLLDAYADEDTQERFWARLKSLHCIPIKSDLLPITAFRDPEVELLSLLPEYYMLPLAFTDELWLEFFRKAGLKKDISESELVQCAQKITTLSTAEFSEDKAKLVIDAATSGRFHKDTLTSLSKIKFIPQESLPVDETLLELCPPVIPCSEYISLDQALVFENDKHRHIFRHSVLCWSVRSTLPHWVELSQELIEIANVGQQPTVTDVCQHMKNLCKNLSDKPSLSTFKSFRKVMYYCLDYLQNPCKCLKRKCDDCAILRSLKQVPFICVKSRNMHVKPTQVILHMPSDIDADVLYPYAFARPTDMAKYDDLLSHIGAPQTPTPDMYAEILHSLWIDVGSTNTLQTNDKQTASLAVYGLFTSLSQQGQRLTTQPLCLPSDKAMMALSTELIIPDSESLVKSMKDRGYQYMCSLSSCHLTKPAKELIFYLPEAVRPKLLSQLVTERVTMDTPCELGLDCPFYNAYYTRLYSENFKQAIWLIARVPEESRSQFSNDLGRLKLLDITCFHQLYGYLSENGRTVEESRVDKIAHVENTLASAKLYIQHQEQYPGPTALVNEVASSIKSVVCYNENYYIDTGSLVELLHCLTEEDIEQYLVEQVMREMETGLTVLAASLNEEQKLEGLSSLHSREDDMSRPRPGTLISTDARDLFLYDPDITFQPKEYVGYAMKTNDQDMIYAKIVRESEQTEGQEMKAMLRIYDLDTGRGYPVQACATDLFKESRRQNLDQCQQVVVSDKRGQPNMVREGSAIIEEAKRTVSKLLNEVYSDPTLWRHREKVKKMLLLKWHPDKAGDSALTTEVFKHLKSEIDRVEAKYSLSDEEEEVEEQVYEWEDVVEEGRTSNNNVKVEKKDDSQSNIVKGDLDAAQIWLRQALVDFQTAQYLLDANTGYEWACHICCEVIRKMMVATIVARSALTSELECTRFTSRLFEAVNRIPGAPADLAVSLLELNKLKVDELTTRQPGVHTNLQAPADVFTKDICTKVIGCTETIQTMLSEFINSTSKEDDSKNDKSEENKE